MVSVPARMTYDLLSDDYLQRSDVTRLYFNMTPWFNQSGDTVLCLGKTTQWVDFMNYILLKLSPFLNTKLYLQPLLYSVSFLEKRKELSGFF